MNDHWYFFFNLSYSFFLSFSRYENIVSLGRKNKNIEAAWALNDIKENCFGLVYLFNGISNAWFM